jgi:hypothetical protein
MSERCTLSVVAGRKSNGDVVREELLVYELGGRRWRLVASPGIVLGLAAGDTFGLDPDGGPVVQDRGGNLAIQLFGPHETADELTTPIEQAGGALDARAPNLTVFTLPVSLGFLRIEKLFRDFVDRHPGMEWYFGNVYEDDGVTPIGWWET